MEHGRGPFGDPTEAGELFLHQAFRDTKPPRNGDKRTGKCSRGVDKYGERYSGRLLHQTPLR